MEGFEDWIGDHKIPLGAWIANGIEALKSSSTGAFDVFSNAVQTVIDGFTGGLLWVPAPLMLLLLTAVAFLVRRSWRLALFVALALLFIMNQGYWQATMETLSLVIFSAIVSTVVGVPLGIASAHRPWLFQVMRPVLDLMQTLPTFVYLIPMLSLFGLGVVPGIIATVIFAVPAPIRMTQLGIASVPLPLREAGEAFGATSWQLLRKVELPHALPAIMEGLTQAIMLALSMSVIATMVGSGGLGVPVLRSLNQVRPAMGFEAGIAIVLVAVLLDRLFRRPATTYGATR